MPPAPAGAGGGPAWNAPLGVQRQTSRPAQDDRENQNSPREGCHGDIYPRCDPWPAARPPGFVPPRKVKQLGSVSGSPSKKPRLHCSVEFPFAQQSSPHSHHPSLWLHYPSCAGSAIKDSLRLRDGRNSSKKRSSAECAPSHPPMARLAQRGGFLSRDHFLFTLSKHFYSGAT